MAGRTILLMALCASLATAQDKAVRDAISDYLNAVKAGNAADKDSAAEELYVEALRRALSRTANHEERAFRRAVFTTESRRLDRHVAGEAAAGASTAIAALTGATDLISAALESGVLNRTTEGNMATFRVNTAGIAQFFSPQKPCFLRSETCKPTAAQWMKSLSVAISFDQATPAAADPQTSATVQPSNRLLPAGFKLPGLTREGEFRAFSARWQMRRRKSLDDADQQTKWIEAMKAVRAEAKTLALAVGSFVTRLSAREDWKTWRAASMADLDRIAGSALPDSEKVTRMTNAFQAGLSTFAESADEELSASAMNAMESISAFRSKRNELLHDVLYPVAVSLEYLYQRPAGQPEYSTVRLIVGKPFGEQAETVGVGPEAEAPLSQFTANLAASFYHSPPAGLSTMRDVQGAVQLDRVLPVRTGGKQKAFASVAGYYQYQAQKGIFTFNGAELTPLVGIPLPQAANVLLDTKGSVFIAQAKMTFPLGASGVNFPIAVSWANRAEYIKASYTKLQFGFTFDLDKLMKAAGQ